MIGAPRQSALVFALIRKWLQPSGFTQNIQRSQRIVGGQDVIFQSLGVIRSHSPHDNALDRRGHRAKMNRKGDDPFANRGFRR